MEQWDTWHKPIFRCDRNLLAQIIIRHVNHSSETFNSLRFNLINDIEGNLRQYCYKLDRFKNLNLKKSKNVVIQQVSQQYNNEKIEVEKNFQLIVRYWEFLNSIGLYEII